MSSEHCTGLSNIELVIENSAKIKKRKKKQKKTDPPYLTASNLRRELWMDNTNANVTHWSR